LEKLEKWFVQWCTTKGDKNFSRFNIDELQQLLFPCQEYDYAKGFAHASRRLAYEFAGHITERNPTRFRHLHLHPRTIGKF
jgi:hypothetical protein